MNFHYIFSINRCILDKTNNDIKRLSKYKKQFKLDRQRNIFLWGKAIEGGNRKVDFDLNNDNIIFKYFYLFILNFLTYKVLKKNAYIANLLFIYSASIVLP